MVARIVGEVTCQEFPSQWRECLVKDEPMFEWQLQECSHLGSDSSEEKDGPLELATALEEHGALSEGGSETLQSFDEEQTLAGSPRHPRTTGWTTSFDQMRSGQ